VTAVDAARAALVTHPIGRTQAEEPAAPGVDATVLTAIGTATGAASVLARLAVLARAGLSKWRLRLHRCSELPALGSTVQLSGSAIGYLEGATVVVVGREFNLATGSVVLTVRGPQ
jgi:hypothetical protein